MHVKPSSLPQAAAALPVFKPMLLPISLLQLSLLFLIICLQMPKIQITIKKTINYTRQVIYIQRHDIIISIQAREKNSK